MRVSSHSSAAIGRSIAMKSTAEKARSWAIGDQTTLNASVSPSAQLQPAREGSPHPLPVQPSPVGYPG